MRVPAVRLLPALITGLAGLTVLSQICYPLTSGTLRDRLTIATVLLWCAASLTHAAVSRGNRFAAAVLAISAGVGFGSEALGVATDLKLPTVHVDWNQIQARMERLGVVRYQKQVEAGAVRVTLVLPAGGRPVEAQRETEAAAVVVALQQAEMQKR